MQPREASTLNIPRSFKPVLIEDAKIKFFKEDERGKFYLLRHPQTLEFIKIHEQAHEAIKLFDGTRTTNEIENELEKLGITIEIRRLIGFLAKEGFIKNLPHPCQKKKDVGKWYSFKIKFMTFSDRPMRKLGRAFSFVKTWPSKVAYVVFCVTGLTIFFYSLPMVFSIFSGMVRLELPSYVFLGGFAAFFVLRILHELAHALAYSFYGGRSVETGIEFHFLIPLAYTDTPDVYVMKDRERVMVFVAGPLLDLFLAGVFALLFFLGFEPAMLWILIALFLYASVLSSLIPIMRTDGYFALQTLLKFPNLLEHGMSNLREILRLVFRRVSLKDYREYLSDYSMREKKILALYTLVFPVFVLTFAYFWVFLALEAGVVSIILLTPQILTGAVSDMKIYVIWALYVVTTIFMLYGMVGALLRLASKQN